MYYNFCCFFFQAIIPMSSSANVGHAVQLFSECDNEGLLYPSSNTVTLVWVDLYYLGIYAPYGVLYIKSPDLGGSIWLII